MHIHCIFKGECVSQFQNAYPHFQCLDRTIKLMAEIITWQGIQQQSKMGNYKNIESFDILKHPM